jgi:hypothetical protein
LVKSHNLPRDDSKAIYVVRDGRLAIQSFVKFQNSYHPGTSSFMSLLLGDHAYGEWTSHYRAWCNRAAGQLLLLRFEELVNPSPEILGRIAEFLGVPGPLRPWVSPLDELRERHPAYFGSGEKTWKPDAFWTDFRLQSFYSLHGKLLTELGYATAAEVEAGAFPPSADENYLLRSVHTLAAQARELDTARNDLHASWNQQHKLQAACDERLALCNSLHEEVLRLAKACEERQEELLRCNEEILHREEATRNHCRMIEELENDRKSLHKRIEELDESLRPLQRYTLLGRLSRFIRI